MTDPTTSETAGASAQLLPCPFCGGPAEAENLEDRPMAWIYCTKCGAKGPSDWTGNEMAAGEVWNRRIGPATASEARDEAKGDQRCSVLQPWLERLPLRMQSTLILGLRGPDTHAAPGVKAIGRWLRGIAFKPGNPANVREFMGGTPHRIVEKGATAKELEFCSQHYYSHLMHSLEVVAYRHPDHLTAGVALDLFYDMGHLMHLPLECSDQFETRLGSVDWPGGKQPNDFAEALLAVAAPAPPVEPSAEGARKPISSLEFAARLDQIFWCGARYARAVDKTGNGTPEFEQAAQLIRELGGTK